MREEMDGIRSQQRMAFQQLPPPAALLGHKEQLHSPCILWNGYNGKIHVTVYECCRTRTKAGNRVSPPPFLWKLHAPCERDRLPQMDACTPLSHRQL